MEQKTPLFKGSIDGVQFDDYRAFTKFLQEHPESTRIECSLDTSAAKPVFKFPTTCRTVENGQVLNPDKLMYPLLETPDHYLATHDQSNWLSDLDEVVTYVQSFIERHKENIKALSIDQLEEHKEVLSRCSADVTEALNFNEEADRSVCNSTTKYSTELDKLNEYIKECKQRINTIRRKEIPALDNKKHTLTTVGKLLGIYEETYAKLINQTTQELKCRKDHKEGPGSPFKQVTSSPFKQVKDPRTNESGMIRLINAIFGL